MRYYLLCLECAQPLTAQSFLSEDDRAGWWLKHTAQVGHTWRLAWERRLVGDCPHMTSETCSICHLLAEAIELLDQCAEDLRAAGWPSPARYQRIERFVAKARNPAQ